MHMYTTNKRKAYQDRTQNNSIAPPSRTEQCPQCDKGLEESVRALIITLIIIIILIILTIILLIIIMLAILSSTANSTA